MKRILTGLLTTVVLLATASTAIASDDSCKDILVYASHNYMQHFTDEQKEAWVLFKKCSASSNSAGLNLFLDSIPFNGSVHINAQSCNDNLHFDSYRSIFNSIESTVSEPALQNWTACMEASSRGLVTRVERPNSATIQLTLKNRTPYPEELTEILVQSDEGAGISCKSAQTLVLPRSIPPSRDLLVNCTRSSINVRRHGIDFKILPGGSITTVTSLGSYSYGFPESFREEPTPVESSPKRIALPLAGQHIGTHAYWGGGDTLLQCSSIAPPAPNFELVVIATREEPVRNPANPRGQCGFAPYCDSAGERCAEVYYANACYVNKEWHDWYKAKALLLGIPYSKESVCAIEAPTLN